MRKIIILIFVILIFFSSSLFAQSNQESNVIDYIFLLDTSGSMVGKPAGSGNKVILPRVKRVIIQYIEDILPPANIIFYTFDVGVKSKRIFDVSEKETIINYVNEIEAPGKSTYVYRSLKKVCKETRNFIDKFKNEQHSAIIQVYTDGNDNDPDPAYTIQSVLDYFDDVKKDEDWLIFYTTLNCDLPPEVEDKIDEHPDTKRTDEISPKPRIPIKNKITHLNLGNLWNLDHKKQSISLGIPPKREEDIPNNFYIHVESKPGNLSNKGLSIKILPDKFRPNKYVNLNFYPQNFEDNQKNCWGKHDFEFELISNDNNIHITPKTVKVKFEYLPPEVRIIPKDDEINFGKLNIYKENNILSKTEVKFDYDQDAREFAGDINISFSQSNENPRRLTQNNFFIDGKKAMNYKTSQNRVEIGVIANKNLPEGKYKGKIEFSSKEYILSGKKTRNLKKDSNTRYVDWEFQIPGKPLPFWAWLIIIILIGGIIAYIIYKKVAPPKLQDLELEVIQPSPDNIDISKENEVHFGENGDKLTDASGIDFFIYAERIGSNVYAKIRVKNGSVYIKRPGEAKREITTTEEIYGNDSLYFGSYEVNVLSFEYTK